MREKRVRLLHFMEDELSIMNDALSKMGIAGSRTGRVKKDY
jgi:hypothetical protein